MKLEDGKYYRTRDGRKVGPAIRQLGQDPSGMSDFRCDWYADGVYLGGQYHPNPLDIVAEWVDGDATPYDERTAPAAAPESELERLVRVANEGAAAEQLLRKNYRQQLESRSITRCVVDSEWHRVGDNICSYEFRLKPKPFQPFYVGPELRTAGGLDPSPSWEVRLSDDGEILNVGCQSFSARAILKDLRALNSGESKCTNTTIYATKQGPRLASARTGISWADADKILAALEKYFAEVREHK